MTKIETIRRLRWHAGLEETTESASPSIAACTWPPSELGEGIDAAVEDFLADLAQFNIELNGTVPSNDIGQGNDIPRFAAYAVAEVIRLLRQYGDAIRADADRRRVVRWIWLVETGWLAVLAGDIDDLLRHLQDEETARGQPIGPESAD